MKNIEEKMERFVTKGFSFSKERIYAQVNDGGLGLFNLTEFVAGLQCSWIKRCYKSINDNLRHTLLLLSNGNILNTVNDNYCLEKVGIALKNIINSYCMFRKCFSEQGDNFMNVPIYCNPAFGYSRGRNNELDYRFFMGEIDIDPEQRNKLIQLTWTDITVNEL